MKSIFFYNNYRQYLSDYYDSMKKTAGLTYRQFSKRAKLNSPNYLALIIGGQRDLTISNIHSFAQALRFSIQETEYFETLVLENQAASDSEKSYYKNRLKAQLHHQPTKNSKLNQSPFFSEWYYTGIWVLSHGQTQEQAIKICHDQLGLKSTVIKKVLDLLIEKSLLQFDSEEKLKISASLTTISDPKSLSIMQEQYLHAQLLQSQKAFLKTYRRGTGKFYSHTLTVPPGKMDLIQQKIIALFHEVTAEMDGLDVGNSELVQMNVQMFFPKSWD